MKRIDAWVTYLQVAPLALVFLLFLVVPILTIVVVSFFDYNTTSIIPAFLIQNYEELLLSPVTWQTYLQTLEFTVITWTLTLVIGFTIAYFLAFHVHSATWQTVLFLVCTIPFWTSNIIRWPFKKVWSAPWRLHLYSATSPGFTGSGSVKLFR